jgi:hypothetical protein
MTMPNGNVYYEIGIRHAARPSGCVLLAAQWSQPLFDAAQLRTIRYPLPEGLIVDDTAVAVREAIRGAIAGLSSGASPMHQAIPGYPTQVDERTAAGTKDQMAVLAAFQGQVRAVRATPRAQRMEQAKQLVVTYGQGLLIPAVAIALMLMLRDCADTAADWNVVLDFIDSLGPDLRALPEVVEQRALSLSYAKRHVEAIAALEALVAESGATQERMGLLGGRYKRLIAESPTDRDRKDALAKSIDCYERGMDLDLNEYYCSSNLPSLYRKRNRAGDEARAQSVLQNVIAACERAKRRGAIDPWLRSTLLVAAFDAADAIKAEELADQVEDEGAAKWQLESILVAMTNSAEHVQDDATRKRLTGLTDRFKLLL